MESIHRLIGQSGASEVAGGLMAKALRGFSTIVDKIAGMAEIPSPLPPAPEESAGFMKLAMRNMVRKGQQSLVHFGLTALGLCAFLLLVAWLGRPRMPL